MKKSKIKSTIKIRISKQEPFPLLLSLLLLLSPAASAGTFSCQWNSADFAGVALSNKLVFITPIAPYGVDGSTLINRDRRRYTNDAFGELIVENMYNGRSYRVEFQGRFEDMVITNSFDTNVTGLVNGADPLYLTAPIRDGNVFGYSQAAADRLFLRRTNGTGSTMTMAGTNTFQAISLGGETRTSWPTGGSGSGVSVTVTGGLTASTNGSLVTVSGPSTNNLATTNYVNNSTNKLDTDLRAAFASADAVVSNGVTSYAVGHFLANTQGVHDGFITIGNATSQKLLRFVPTNTNTVSGSPNWTFEQTFGNQTTNREIIFSESINYESGSIQNTNLHGWRTVHETHWDPFDPSTTRQMEHYRVFHDRSSGVDTRYSGEVLRDGDIEQNQLGRYFWWGDPTKQLPVMTLTTQNAYGDDAHTTGSGALGIYGSASIFSSTNTGAGHLTMYGRGGASGSGAFLSLQDQSLTKSLTLYGDGYGLGADGEALVWATQPILRLLAAQEVRFSTNVRVFGNISMNLTNAPSIATDGNGKLIIGGASSTFNPAQFEPGGSGTNIKSGATITNPVVWQVSYTTNTPFYFPTNTPTTAGDTLVAAVFPNSQGYTKWGVPSFATTAGTAQSGDTADDFFGSGVIGPARLAPTNGVSDGTFLGFRTGTNFYGTPPGGGDVLTAQLNAASNTLYVAKVDTNDTRNIAPTGYWRHAGVSSWTNGVAGTGVTNNPNGDVSASGTVKVGTLLQIGSVPTLNEQGSILTISNGLVVANGQIKNHGGFKADTSGNVEGSKFTATNTTTGFIGEASGLTNLNASNLASGTVAAPRLGTGSGGSTKFLREDSTWQTVAVATSAPFTNAVVGYGEGDTTNMLVVGRQIAATNRYGIAILMDTNGYTIFSNNVQIANGVKDTANVDRLQFGASTKLNNDNGATVVEAQSSGNGETTISSGDHDSQLVLDNSGNITVVGTITGYAKTSVSNNFTGGNLFSGNDTNVGSLRVQGSYRVSSVQPVVPFALPWTNAAFLVSTNAAFTLTEYGSPAEGSQVTMTVTNKELTNWLITLPRNMFSEAQNQWVSTLNIWGSSRMRFLFWYENTTNFVSQLGGPNAPPLSSAATNNLGGTSFTNLAIVSSDWIPIGAWWSNNIPGTPYSSASAVVITNSGDAFEFAQSATNCIRFRWGTPWDYNGGTVKAMLTTCSRWTNDTGGNTKLTNALFAIRMAALTNGVQEDNPSWGTAVWSTNKIHFANTNLVSYTNITTAITIGGNITNNTDVLIEIQRLGATTNLISNTTNLVALIGGVKIFYQRNTRVDFPASTP